MKWFIVLMAVINGQPVVWVEDNVPYDTPTKCEQQRASMIAQVHGPNPVRVFCGANHVVADFVTGNQ
jgi:hypothetical protein